MWIFYCKIENSVVFSFFESRCCVSVDYQDLHVSTFFSDLYPCLPPDAQHEEQDEQEDRVSWSEENPNGDDSLHLWTRGAGQVVTRENGVPTVQP